MNTQKPTPLSDEYFRKKAHDIWDKMRHEKFDDDQQAIYILLKEVSRDTRHACAEVRVKGYPFDTFSGGGMDDETEERMRGFDEGQEAHADACMNVGGKL